MHVYWEKSDEIYKIKGILSNDNKLHIVDEINENSSYEEKWFSVSNSNCSKGNALKIVSKYLNIPIKNTIAIGNDKNDIPMFEVAGLSVAVANASDDIKSKVNHITLSNDEDGVAIFLETLIKYWNLINISKKYKFVPKTDWNWFESVLSSNII